MRYGLVEIGGGRGKVRIAIPCLPLYFVGVVGRFDICPSMAVSECGPPPGEGVVVLVLKSRKTSGSKTFVLLVAKRLDAGGIATYFTWYVR